MDEISHLNEVEVFYFRCNENVGADQLQMLTTGFLMTRHRYQQNEMNK